MQNHQNTLEQWLQHTLHQTSMQVIPLTGDASFRKYYRVHQGEKSYIVMDAPPAQEPLAPFLTIQKLLASHQIRVPTVHVVDEQQGFALLEDFGDTLLLQLLKTSHAAPQQAEKYYHAALKLLNQLQTCHKKSTFPLAAFDTRFMTSELELFKHWFLEKYLGLELSPSEKQLVDDTCQQLTQRIMEQPTVCIHRDYHSRNIMVLKDDQLGIIDFQDAMLGPFTYDAVSLLKDCYMQWPTSYVTQWLHYFYNHSPYQQQCSFDEFHCAFDYCGLQRHLKVLGIFARLYLRDNKPQYLQDLPLTRQYVMACLETYPTLHAFYEFMNTQGQLPDANSHSSSGR